MDAFLPFVVAGITAGTVYGLAASGLVLTYKTSGIFNFAHGAVAAASAYLFYELRTMHGLPWPVAAAVVLLAFAPLLGVAFELVARRVSGADPATRIVATVGVLLLIQGLATVHYGAATIDFRPFLPTETFSVAGVRVGWDQAITVAVAALSVAGLFVFFRRSRLGLDMRAVVQDPVLLDLTGGRPVAVRRAAWVIGSSFAALSGLLLAPSIGLDAALLTLLVVQAFGAAALGRFENLGLTFAGGLAIGVAANLLVKYVPSHPKLAGLPSSLPFLVLFAVLVFSPPGRFQTRAPRRRSVRAIRLSRPARALAVAVAVAVVGVVPSLVGARLPVYTNGAIHVTIFVSLALLVTLSAQVSLCQATFVALGATTFSHLTSGAGLPWAAALALAGLAVVPLGALVALPAIRLSGLYLALATFGFGILVERVGYSSAVMFGVTGFRTAPRPDVFGLTGDRGWFYLSAAVATGALAVGVAVNRGRLGRLLRALADSPVALATNGANANTTRVLVFCLSAFLAAVAGGLFVASSGTVNGSGFNAFQSLTYLAVLTVAGQSIVVGPIVASLLFVVAPAYQSSPDLGAYLQMIFGAAAVAVSCFGASASDWLARSAAATMRRRQVSPVRARTADGLVVAR
jgi:branched-subunit amino acid ABC-type transport system permease component